VEISDFMLAVAFCGMLLGLCYVVVFLNGVRLAFHKERFKCKQCGNCCRLRIIEMKKDDVERIKKAGFKDFFVKEGREYWFKRKNGRCVFQKENGPCSIYGVRADICRNFPFFRIFGVEYCRDVSFCPAIEDLKKNVKSGGKVR